MAASRISGPTRMGTLGVLGELGGLETLGKLGGLGNRLSVGAPSSPCILMEFATDAAFFSSVRFSSANTTYCKSLHTQTPRVPEEPLGAPSWFPARGSMFRPDSLLINPPVWFQVGFNGGAVTQSLLLLLLLLLFPSMS